MWGYSVFFALIVLFLQESYTKYDARDDISSQSKDDWGVKILATEFTKSWNDETLYRMIELSNGLKVMLASMPTFTTAAASMSVNVGTHHDPKEVPGIAHFCEHLLFLGNEKYPEEDAFESYVGSYGGTHNAQTGSEETTYFFDIQASAFEKALDIFSHFFINPLFSKDTVEREAMAVDSEDKKNSQIDGWRVSQLERHISNNKSAYHGLPGGNYKTLIENPRKNNIDIIKVLKDFYSEYYSPERMKLVIASNVSLDNLQEFAVKYFSQIPKRGPPKEMSMEPPFTKEHCQKIYFYQSINNFKWLELVFPTEGVFKLYKTRPYEYLVYLINHEIAGSLRKYLFDEGLAKEISVGLEYLVANRDLFRIAIELTSEGYENYEKVVEIVFQYLKTIEEKGIQEWICKELKAIDEIGFRFQEQQTPLQLALGLSSVMLEEYIEYRDLLNSAFVTEYNLTQIREFFSFLKPDNFFIFFMIHDRPEGWECVEPWYGSKYAVKDFSKSLIEKLKQVTPNDVFKLPERNIFIPEEFYFKEPEKEQARTPKLVHSTPFLRLWFKTDDSFRSPKAYLGVLLHSSGFSYTPIQAASAAVFAEMFLNEIRDTLYYAYIAGYTVFIYPQSMGYQLIVSGYIDKIYTLLGSLIKSMIAFVPKNTTFEYFQRSVLDKYTSYYTTVPYKQLGLHYNVLFEEKAWTKEDIIDALKGLSYYDILAFKAKQFFRLSLEALIVGAMPLSMVHSIVKDLGSLSKVPMYPMQMTLSRSYMLEKGANYFYQRQLKNINEPNSAILYVLQFGGIHDSKEIVLIHTMYFIAKDPLYSTLRTQEQLGYIVRSAFDGPSTLLDYQIMIQSLRNPFYLEQRITAFLYKLAAIIDNMDEEQFRSYVDLVYAYFDKKPASIYSEGQTYWSSMLNGYYAFEKSLEIMKATKSVTIKDLRIFFYRYVYPTAPERKKLSIHLHSKMLEEVSVYDIPIQKLYHYLKCKKLSLSLETLIDLRETSKKLVEFEKAIVSLVQETYSTKNVSSIISDAFTFLKEQRIKTRKKAMEDYNAKEITDVMFFKSFLKLTEAPNPMKPLEEYIENILETG